jgi:phage terminase large subunit
LLTKAAGQKTRILCAREVQKSIRDSVHKLLADQIENMGIGHQFDVLETEIRGKNGSEFLFAGLLQHTVESIKSFEGADVCWVEEAHVVSKRSWDILIPTIRTPGSEIWVTFNPDLDTDETYTRFVVSPPPNAVVVKVNYADNPWFPPELEAERVAWKERDPKGYPNVWDGIPKSAVDGAVYADEIAKVHEEGRILNLPVDPLLKTHVVFDLGFNDSMAMIFAQRRASELRLVDYIEVNQKTLDWCSQQMRGRGYRYGTIYLPHDARAKDYKSGKSAEEMMRAMGWTVQIVPSLDVESGIQALRMAFPRLVFDKARTARLVECLKRYRRGLNAKTNEPMAPLHDEYSHGADAARYMALVADAMQNDDWSKSTQKENYAWVT